MRQRKPTSLVLRNLLVVLAVLLLILLWTSSHALSWKSASSSHATTAEGNKPRDEFAELLGQSSAQLSRVPTLERENAALRLELNQVKEAYGQMRKQQADCDLQRNNEKLNRLGSSSPSTMLPPQGELQKQQQQGSSSARLLPWLVVGIPTVPRRGDDAAQLSQSLLSRVLHSYLHQMELVEAIGQGVRVVVGSGAKHHAVFTALSKQFQRYAEEKVHPMAAQFEFHVTAAANAEEEERERALDADQLQQLEAETHERPSEAVQRQTLDVARLLQRVQGTSSYFLFTEDDFELCPNALLALSYAIGKSKAYFQPNQPFAALRCGFGLNGIVLHNHPQQVNDVGPFQQYLSRHFARRPPDHLVVEFYAKESDAGRAQFGSRRVAAFRHNLFLHLGGRVSTLRDEEAWSMPQCFAELVEPQLFAVEAWNPHDCAEDDFWPCDGRRGEVMRWNVSASRQWR